MTPERVAEIAASVEFEWHCSDDVDVPSTVWNIERAIHQAVSEALEEAAKVCTDYGAMYCHNAIRALKLPEE